MSKKHFIELANYTRQLLAQQTTQYDEETKDYVSFPLFNDEQKEAIRRMLADFCGDQNPRFDRWRWLSYLAGECGPNGGKIKPCTCDANADSVATCERHGTA